MANISAIKLPDGYTYTIVDNTSGWTDNEGTVTSVRVQASSPVQSSVSTEQNTSLNTTISLADGYGDTKNPYASKTKNYVLAAPSNANGVPSFRALVAADIPIADWAKESTKPSYNFSEIGSKPNTLSGYGINNAYTKTEVDNLITNLPEPMIFKGSLGTDGTITSLPAAATTNEGYTYKVITAGTYASQDAKVGDTFISDGSTWILIPSGDEPSGTVTSITLKAGSGISIDNSTAITTSGERTISHADTSSQSSISASGRRYITAITLDTYGHVTGLSTGTETVTNTTYSLTQDSTDGHKITLTPSSGTAQTITIPDNNSWRPVENVLNSDSTTNSLSAAQGKALATGSARDNTKLPLVGGTMTGQILIDNVAGPKINSNNIDLKVWEVVGNSGSWNSEFGFHELYKGTGSGNDNTLELYAHNQAGTHVKVRTIKQDGTITWHTTQTFANTIQGSITGSAGSVAWSGITSKPNLVNTITTTAGAHTIITSQTGNVSFNVPTTAAHVGIKFGYTTSGNNRAVLQDANGNLYVTQKDDNSWRGIQDNLNSTSATDSLSANQGKILNESKLSLTGGNVTGPVTFGDSVEIDEATIGDLIVNGNGNFTNNLQVNTINGVAVGSNPKFTDTLMTVATSGDGNAVTSVSASGSVITVTKGATYSSTDTKNTAGSNDTSSKIFLVGTTAQTTGSNALQTYSQDTVYVGTDGCLYSNNKQVLTDHQSLSGYVPTSRTIDGKALTGNITLHTSKTATLSTSWSSKQQTVSVTGVTTSNTVIISPAPASYNDYCGCGVYCSAQAADSLTFKCEDVPSAALTVNILIIG